jgi:hypothetical protein
MIKLPKCRHAFINFSLGNFINQFLILYVHCRDAYEMSRLTRFPLLPGHRLVLIKFYMKLVNRLFGIRYTNRRLPFTLLDIEGKQLFSDEHYFFNPIFVQFQLIDFLTS